MRAFSSIIPLFFFIRIFSQNQIPPPPMERDPVIKEGVDIFRENDLYGIKDFFSSEILLPAKYSYINKQEHGNFVLFQNNKYGLYSLTLKKVVIEPNFSNIRIENCKFNNRLGYVIYVEKDYKTGMLDSLYNYILPIEYSSIVTYKNHAAIRKGEDRGLLIYDGYKMLIPPIQEAIYDYDSVVISLKENKNSLYINNKLILNEQNHIGHYSSKSEGVDSDRLHIINQQNQHGIYSILNKKYLVPVKYDYIDDYRKGFYTVKFRNKYGLIDSLNNISIPFDYDTLAIVYLKDRLNFLIASKNSKYGLIDRNNKIIVDFQYEDIKWIGGLYKAKLKNAYIVLDSLGNKISDDLYDEIGYLLKGKAAVFRGDKIGYITEKGNIIEPTERKSLAKGFKNRKEMLKSLVQVLKSKNDTLLRQFCQLICPDEYSLEFMQRIDYEKYGIPSGLKRYNVTLQDLAQKYYESLTYCSKVLQDVNNIEIESFEDNMHGTWIRNDDVAGFYKFGIKVKIDKKRYILNLGVLENIDGYWKSFTKPHCEPH